MPNKIRILVLKIQRNHSTIATLTVQDPVSGREGVCYVAERNIRDLFAGPRTSELIAIDRELVEWRPYTTGGERTMPDLERGQEGE